MPELPRDWSRFAEQMRRYVEADDEEALATYLTDHALDVADALQRIPELELERDELKLQRAERVEAALDRCWQLVDRSEGRVSEELHDILAPLFGSGAALATAPAEELS